MEEHSSVTTEGLDNLNNLLYPNDNFFANPRSTTGDFEIDKKMFERYVDDEIHGSGKRQRLQPPPMYSGELKPAIYAEDQDLDQLEKKLPIYAENLDQLENACKILKKEKEDIDISFQGYLIGRDILPEETEVGVIEILGKHGLLQRQLNRELQNIEPHKKTKNFLSKEKIDLFGHLPMTYEFCEAYIPKSLEYFKDLLSGKTLLEINQPIKIELENRQIEIPLWEALEYEGVRLRPKNSNPTTSYFIDIVPDWGNPKHLRKDGYAVVAQITSNGLEVYDKKLAVNAFRTIEEVSGNEFWSGIRKKIEDGKIPETNFYPPQPRYPSEERKRRYPTEERKSKKTKIPRWAKILAGVGVAATIGAWGLNLYNNHLQTEQRIKPLVSAGYTRDEALSFDGNYSQWAINNQYNSSVMKFAVNLKNYPETSLALLQSMGSLEKINRSFDSLLPYLQNQTFSNKEISSFVSSYPSVVNDGINETGLSHIKYWMKFPGLFDKVAKECPVLTQTDLMNGDFDKDGFTNHEELLFGFNPTNPQEKILLPIKNDTTLLAHISKFEEYNQTGVRTIFSNQQTSNLETIVNGCLGHDQEFNSLNISNDQISKIYRLYTLATGYLGLNSSWPIIGVNLSKNHLKNYGIIEPSNDLTLCDAIIQEFVGSKEPSFLREDPLKLVRISDYFGFYALPTFNSTVYEFRYMLNQNSTELKYLNSLLDGDLNNTPYLPSLNEKERTELIPLFKFLWDINPQKTNSSDNLDLLVYQTTSLGFLSLGKYPQDEWYHNNFYVENNNQYFSDRAKVWSLSLTDAGKIFDEINSKSPDVFSKGTIEIIKYVNDNLHWSVVGCEEASTLVTKILQSRGIPVVQYHIVYERFNGEIGAHFSPIYPWKGNLVFDKNYVQAALDQPNLMDIQKTLSNSNNLYSKPIEIQVLDISTERAPVKAVYSG
jgi:hypothetical protein